jgi:serine protease Do
MNDFYEFDEARYQRKSRIKGYIFVAIIFLLIGALGFYAISPYIMADNNQSGGQTTDNREPDISGIAQLPGEEKDSEKDRDDNRVALGSSEDLYIDPSNPVADIAEKVEKAVVGITNKSEITISDFFFREWTQETEGYGSGIIISEEGYVLTNHHVIENAKQLFVIMHDGETVEAELIGSDPHSDIAVLKIDVPDLTVAKIGDSDKVRKGDFAIAIGNPLGHELAGSVNFGVISAPIRTLELDGRTMELIQTDAAINRGNSGGALVNMNGEVIGMNTLKFGGNLVEGLGFAIPSNVFVPIAQEIIETGKVTYPQKPWLGITIREITEALSKEYGYPVGVIVIDIQEDSAAEEAGIRPGDVILGMDGKDIETIDDLRAVLESHEVGDVIEIELWRRNTEFTLKVKLGGVDVVE